MALNNIQLLFFAFLLLITVYTPAQARILLLPGRSNINQRKKVKILLQLLPQSSPPILFPTLPKEVGINIERPPTPLPPPPHSKPPFSSLFKEKEDGVIQIYRHKPRPSGYESTNHD
ncbi:hypothetical protein F8388_026012 [Cannabis sativa]|uniref:Uncharacterized protein n=1 Tax=Cannabis sativa TaxID=3483 RepID=A0A7J6EED7_CANSA|nr:hypothetical protein F8388_026012 [Cannabis sativa]